MPPSSRIPTSSRSRWRAPTASNLDEQISETLIAKSVELGDSSMVVMSAAAKPASPIKPNLVQNVLIALVLGLMIFTLLAFVLEYLGNTVKGLDDFKEMELMVLGIIPKIDTASARQAGVGRLEDVV